MKKILSFTLAVVLALSLLIGSAFASSGVGSYFTPDTFISWGDTNNPYTLSVPSVAITDRKFIVYQVRDWALSYLRVRFVIDSFDSDIVPVEGESLAGWIRYSGTWALGVNAALEPDYYSTSLFADDRYTFSKSFLHKPVYSNFDYYDSDGELILSGDTSGVADDSLMDLTLNDGTVIQVPRSLQGNYFVVANSGSQYKIWLFLPNQVEQGLVYEGSTEALYFTSDGAYSDGSSSVVVSWSAGSTWNSGSITVDLNRLYSTFNLSFSDYPYIFVGNPSGISSSDKRVYIQVFTSIPTASATSSADYYNFYKPDGSRVFSYRSKADDFITYSSFGSFYVGNFEEGSLQSNFDVYSSDGLFLHSSTFSLGDGGFTWSPWLTMSTALDITQYGDIVYQSFYYPLSSPEVDPTPTPSPSPTTTPDGSNNGLFAWLKQQWVFLMGKLDEIIAAIKDLIFDLDPFPDQTKPILDDFFEHIFPDRVSSDDVSGIGNVLDKMGDWFNTGYGLNDLFGVFDDDGFDSWFSNETQDALDSVGSEE